MSTSSLPRLVNNPQDELTRHWRQVIGILAKRGGRFVLMKRASKGAGLAKGWNLPENTHSAAEAVRHLDRGGNVGLASGSGDVYAFDFDAHADRGHECPQLGGTLYTYRENAPSRAKFFFTCKERLPRKTQANGVELLGWTSNDKHWNAVVAGIHNSGAPIRWGGHTVAELDRDTVAALWEDFTGQELDGYSGEDLAFEADPDATADDLLQAAIQAGSIGNRDNACFALCCHLRDRLIGIDAAKAVVLAYQKAVTDPRNPYTQAEALSSLRSAYSRPPRPPKYPNADRIANATVEFLMTAGGSEALREAGITRISNARPVLMALLRRMAERRSLSVTYPARDWGHDSGTTYQTALNWAERLIKGGIITAERPEIAPGETGAIRYTLVLNSVLTKFDTRGRDPEHPTATPSTAAHPTTTLHHVKLSTNWNETLGEDAYMANHGAYTKRKPDALAPLGPNAWAGLPVLLDLGEADTSTVAAELGQSYGVASRWLRRAADYGILAVETGPRNRKLYSVRGNYVEDVRAITPKMTTHGLRAKRQFQNAINKLEWAKRSGDKVRIERAARHHDDLLKRMGVSFTRQILDVTTGEIIELSPSHWVQSKKLVKPGYWLRWDEAEQTAQLGDLRDEVQRLRLGKVEPRHIVRMLRMGGWTGEEIFEAMRPKYMAEAVA